MTRSCRAVIWLLLIAVGAPAEVAFAQRPAGKSQGAQQQQQYGAPSVRPHEELAIRVYAVLDLVLPTPNYAFQSTVLPTLADKGSISELGQFPNVAAIDYAVLGTGMMTGEGGYGGGMSGRFGGEMGGGFGGMAGAASPPGAMPGMGGGMPGMGMGMGAMPGMGGGAVQLPSGAILGGGLQITLPRLMQAIQMFVDPPSWSGVGGSGTLVALGSSLVVSQTPANHARLDEFLAQLRSESGSLRTVTVEARWLLLDSQQLQEIAGDGASDQSLHPETERYRGCVTCFNGQTVHIVSGRLQTVIQGGIPVVGGEAVGYQPQLLKPHIGAMLQVTPTVLPDGKAAIVDVRSIVTRGDQPPQPVALYGPHVSNANPTGMPSTSERPTVQVDRLNIAAQQLATTLRVPLGRPTLVGGLTFPAVDGDAESQNRQQLYLVIEVKSGS